MVPAKLFFANLIVLFLILLLERSVRLMQEMSLLGIGIGHLAPLVTAMVPFSLNLAFPATFGVAMVIAIDRLTREREIECLSGLGLSPWRIVLPMVLFGLVAGLANLSVSGWLEPIGRHAYREQMAMARHRIDLASFQPGAIYSPTEDLMLTSDTAVGGRLGRLLVWSRDNDGSEVLASAASGSLRTDPDSALIVLDLVDGRSIAAQGGRAAGPLVIDFKQMSLSATLGEKARHRARGRDAKELTLAELSQVTQSRDGAKKWRQAVAEIWVRLARALTIPLMPLLILPLIAGSPPGRRAPAIFLIAGLMMASHHGINFARQIGAENNVPPALPQQLLIGGLAALIALIWTLGRRLPGTTPLSLLARLQWTRRHNIGRNALTLMLPGLGMTMLPRYIAWQVMRSTLAVWLFMAAVLGLIDVIEAGDTLVRAGAGLMGLLQYLLLRAPAALLQALPVAALGGPLVAFLAMRNTRQLTVVQTLGMSAFRILQIASVPALVMAALGFSLAELAVPRSEITFVAWWEKIERTAGEAGTVKQRWFRIGQDIVRISDASADGTALAEPMILRRDADGSLTQWLRAQSARHSAEGWVLVESERLDAAHPVRRFVDHAGIWQTALMPSDVRRLGTQGDKQDARQAARALRQRVPSRHAPAFYATRLAYRWALPAMPFVMLLLAMPVVFASQQPRQVARSVVMTAMAGLAFLVLDGVMRILGTTGQVAPWLAVWLAPALFLLLGLRMLLRSESVA